MKSLRVTALVVLLAGLLTAGLSAQDAAEGDQDKSAKGAVGALKFSGLMFGDFFYNVDAMKESSKDVNGWQFRRIYFTTDYTINSTFSSRFRLEADQSALASNGKISVFVKDAWLKWKDVFAGSDLYVGMSPTPAFEVSESAWGYRSLEKTTMDYFGVVSSRDLGIDLKGKIDKGGMVKYWLKLGNNSGNSAESNKYKRYYASIQVKPTDEFQFTVYADYASMPQVSDAVSGTMKDNNALVAAGFLNYRSGKTFSIGLESFYKSQANNYSMTASDPLTAQSGLGVSAFAWLALSDDIQLVGRFDTYDPNTDSEIKDDVRSLIVGAVDFQVASNVNIMPGVEIKKLEGSDNSDIIPRVTFFWQF